MGSFRAYGRGGGSVGLDCAVILRAERAGGLLPSTLVQSKRSLLRVLTISEKAKLDLLI